MSSILFTLILFNCEQVYQRLQKIGLGLSHQQTIRIVDNLGEDFDKKVLKWKENAEISMDDTVRGLKLIA